MATQTQWWFWRLYSLPDGRECAVKILAADEDEVNRMPPPVEGALPFATWRDICHAENSAEWQPAPAARFGLH